MLNFCPAVSQFEQQNKARVDIDILVDPIEPIITYYRYDSKRRQQICSNPSLFIRPQSTASCGKSVGTVTVSVLSVLFYGTLQ